VAVSAGILVTIASAVALHPGLRKRVGMLLEDGLGMRQQLLLHGWDRFLERPILGWGPGLYRELHAAGIESGWQSGGEPLPNVVIPWVHCLPLELLIDVGVLGFAAAVATVLIALRRAWTARRRDDLKARAAIGGGCALVVLGVIALVDLSMLKEWVRCASWLALGLAFLQRRDRGDLTGDPAR
jgi:O-antigen ligase